MRLRSQARPQAPVFLHNDNEHTRCITESQPTNRSPFRFFPTWRSSSKWKMLSLSPAGERDIIFHFVSKGFCKCRTQVDGSRYALWQKSLRLQSQKLGFMKPKACTLPERADSSQLYEGHSFLDAMKAPRAGPGELKGSLAFSRCTYRGPNVTLTPSTWPGKENKNLAEMLAITEEVQRRAVSRGRLSWGGGSIDGKGPLTS